jgi:hypothetical protein
MRELLRRLARVEYRHRSLQVAKRTDHQERPLIEECVPMRLMGSEVEGRLGPDIFSGFVLQDIFRHQEEASYFHASTTSISEHPVRADDGDGLRDRKLDAALG